MTKAIPIIILKKGDLHIILNIITGYEEVARAEFTVMLLRALGMENEISFLNLHNRGAQRYEANSQSFTRINNIVLD